MNQQRRIFLKRAGITGAAILSIGAGLLKPAETLAAEAGKTEIGAKGVMGAMSSAGYAGAVESKQIDTPGY